MAKDHLQGILIILGIIAIALFGGAKRNPTGGLFYVDPATQTQTQAQNTIIDQRIQEQTEADKKNQSQYKGTVSILNVSSYSDPTQEYVGIMMNGNSNTTPIDITGWTLKSAGSGIVVTIPRGTYLFTSGAINNEQDIVMTSGDRLYIITGLSPIGYNFKTNKCSGYLNQFQTFVPSMNTSCPIARDENLSNIPRTKNNDICFDYIDSIGQCRTETGSARAEWSSECIDFIYTKLNYNSCINIHKNDNDFYHKEWRVYLKRSESLWGSRRESIVLYDNQGKFVDSINY